MHLPGRIWSYVAGVRGAFEWGWFSFGRGCYCTISRDHYNPLPAGHVKPQTPLRQSFPVEGDGRAGLAPALRVVRPRDPLGVRAAGAMDAPLPGVIRRDPSRAGGPLVRKLSRV